MTSTPRVVLWPSGFADGWDGGPDLVVYPVAPLEDALRTRHGADVWVPAYEIPAGEASFPRLNAAAANADPDGLGRLGGRIRVPIAFVDLDRPAHAPWPGGPSGVPATSAFRALVDLLDDAFAVYTTRAGARVVYLLDAPPTLDDAAGTLRAFLDGWRARYGAAVECLGLEIDDSAPSPWRGFRAPYATRDGTPLAALLEVRESRPRAATPRPLATPGRRDGPVPDRPLPDPWPRPEPLVVEDARLPARVREYAPELASGAPLSPLDGGSRHALHLHLINALAWYFGTSPSGPEGIAERIFGAVVRSIAAAASVATTPDTVEWAWVECLRAEGREIERAAEADRAFEAVRAMAGATETRGAADPPPVLALGASYLVFDAEGGSYVGPLHANGLYTTLRDLHPSIPRVKGQGSHLPGAMIVDMWGDRADRALLVPEGSTPGAFVAWDPRTKTARIRVARLAEITPTHHADVAGWLDALVDAPEDRARLLAWVATLGRLDFPTAAIYLHGVDSAGKSMLATAAARLWGVPPVSFEAAVDNFNAGLRDSPVVHLDEGVGSGGLTRRMSSAFRRLVSERYHEVNAKHLAPVTLETHLRVVITANNPNALRTAESHTAEDIGAIAKRVLYLKVSPRASEYLADLGGREYTREWVQRTDGSPGLVVEHFAYLAQTLDVVPDGRFLVSGRTTQYHRELVTRGVPTGDVLVAVAASILSARGPVPDLVPDPEDEAIVWANAAALHSKWRTLIDEDAPRPNVSAVGDALRAAATGSSARQAIPGGAGRRARYWPVSLAYVLEAAETAGLPDVDSIPSRVRAMGPSGTVVAYNTPRHEHRGAP